LHELSIASALVELASMAVRSAGARKVIAVHLRMGVLSAISVDSLRFCYDVVTENTLLAGSRLVVNVLPIRLHCSKCDRESEILDLQRLECPTCKTPNTDIRQGCELEIDSIEFEE
jgi:hydrogenase nickel incorporation protein HypA/HybF